MSSPNIDGKAIVNTMYHGAVVTGLAIGLAKLTKGLLKEKIPKLDLTGYDVGLVTVYVSTGLALRDVLVKMELPDNILK